MTIRKILLAFALPMTVLAGGLPAAMPAARAADAACAPSGADSQAPGWDVAGRLARREDCLAGRGRAYRDGVTKNARQRLQAGQNAVDAVRDAPQNQMNRLRNAGTTEQNRLNALGQQTRGNIAGVLTGGL
ncbi:hypothetical protein ACLRDC_18345 [Gluconacetobacter sacchari]|uniref:Uncharacterized protein n=2 Tax=Gluconacetobacter sacchari TaxID=92759 RepID=A0A7W4NTF8_9PROT|nr:hypothetical protein [Gluconacetobacter sacchari]MBB2162255.1 hypothetical protein [Gluconacetobacter sacchari]GBQ22500.1 hypothetical protein AA12717_1207 [Gluconacetobacter sacchari DSM 12717]